MLDKQGWNLDNHTDLEPPTFLFFLLSHSVCGGNEGLVSRIFCVGFLWSLSEVSPRWQSVLHYVVRDLTL
jgi:hypothetical protein